MSFKECLVLLFCLNVEMILKKYFPELKSYYNQMVHHFSFAVRKVHGVSRGRIKGS